MTSLYSFIQDNNIVILHFPHWFSVAPLCVYSSNSRGFKEADFVRVVDLLDEAVAIARSVQAKTAGKLKEFQRLLDTDRDAVARCDGLRDEVNRFAAGHPMPGHEDH